jgi:hypothetical protein
MNREYLHYQWFGPSKTTETTRADESKVGSGGANVAWLPVRILTGEDPVFLKGPTS